MKYDWLVIGMTPQTPDDLDGRPEAMAGLTSASSQHLPRRPLSSVQEERRKQIRRDYQRRYQRTEKGQATKRRWDASPKGKAFAKARREKTVGYAKRHATQLRLNVFAVYGGQCACCGERDPHFLCIDHIYNDGAEHRAQKIGSIYAWLTAHGYPRDRFQLLCFNCNSAKEFSGACPHTGQRVLPFLGPIPHMKPARGGYVLIWNSRSPKWLMRTAYGQERRIAARLRKAGLRAESTTAPTDEIACRLFSVVGLTTRSSDGR